jgi:hypothetical protein
MSTVTELGTGQISNADTLAIEPVESDETPPVIVIRWPAKATILHPRRFGSAAETATRVFAGAVVRLAYIRRDHRRL